VTSADDFVQDYLASWITGLEGRVRAQYHSTQTASRQFR
jgi:hypothetical protein